MNDMMRREFAVRHIDAGKVGWASVQLDRGISNTLEKIEAWFRERLSEEPAPRAGTPGGTWRPCARYHV